MKVLSSLTNRIFLASAALTVLCISVAIYLVNARVTRAADDELRLALEQSEAVVEQQRATVFELFLVVARTVADLPRLKAAVATGDPPTVQGVAQEYRANVPTDLLLVDDQTSRLLAFEAPRGVSGQAAMALDSIRAAHAGRETAAFLPLTGGLLEVVSVPITAGAEPPQIVGTLTLGFLLDDALAARFRQLTGSEVAFAVKGRVVASTLPPSARPALEPLLQGEPGAQTVWAANDDYLALVRPLEPGRKVAATPTSRTRSKDGRATMVVLRSRTERLRLLRPIQTALVATGFVAVLLAIALSYMIARTITRPLAAITDVMRQMAATGDLTRKIDWQPSRWGDEDARLLAGTFNTLTGSITRFQREAAERERLSALGRLSMVIAHEVRNPLMIIKASLRPLIRGTASATEVGEAARDIDEEVFRLNRLVNDVLDFARPLRFELAPADVNAVCEASVAAATTDLAHFSVRLALDRSIKTVVTDAERLRAALVNVVVNACHAVAAQPRRAAAGKAAGPQAADDEPDIELITKLLNSERYVIIVRDRGIGIDASELPRVFDPYFTTKRAGTGLGLAITRNIIQGLGGTIEVSSQRGAGTEIRMEMPTEAPEERHS